MQPPTFPSPVPTSSVRAALDWHRPLMLTAALCLALLAVAAVGLVVDDRTLANEPIWLKPAKFALSIAVYNVTLAWLFSLLRGWRRVGWWLGTVIAVLITAELVVIVLQAVRGERSHFNVGTSFDAALFNLMGTMIVTVWVANLGIGVILLVQQVGERSTAWAVRIGTAVTLAGMAVAFLMSTPTDEQMVSLESGAAADVVGAHTVGMPDGGSGLPGLGWSTVAGDLRVPHFLGLHGLQVLILLALVLAVLGHRCPSLEADSRRLRVVAVAGAAYAALVALTTWQALRGQSVVRPDSLTLAVAGAVVAVTAVGLWWALRSRVGESAREQVPERV